MKQIPIVGDIRQRGFMVGIELVRNTSTREPFPLKARIGHRVAMEARKQGLLLRPIGNVIILMPPLSASQGELKRMLEILAAAMQTGLDSLPHRSTQEKA